MFDNKKMGRFYSGSIEGKFWFGVQSSNDVENLLSISANPAKMLWFGCDCYVEDENDKYCKDCYDSLEDFLDKEGGLIEGGVHFYEDNEIVYEIDESYLHELNTVLKEIENLFEEDLKKLCEKLPHNLQNAFDGHFTEIVEYNNKHETHPNQIMARYCLGRQIKYSLETEGTCHIYCEL